MDGSGKKKRRRGARLSKSERVAKRACRLDRGEQKESLEEVIEQKRFDQAEKLALELDSASGSVANTVVFLKSLPKRKTLRHYVERASRIEHVRTTVASVLLPELVASRRLEDAVVAAAPLGVRPVSVAAAALDDEDNECSIRGVLDASLARDLLAAAAEDEKRVSMKWLTVVQRCVEMAINKTPLVGSLRDYCPPIDETERQNRRTAAERIVKIVDASSSTSVECRAFAFGSTVTELDGPEEKPDVDVVVLFGSSTHVLEILAASLKTTDHFSNVRLVPARVPTIRCVVEDYDVDIVANNVAAVCNTAMLAFLANRCPLLAALNRLARRFSKAHDVRGARRRNLSSYAWTLLSIRAIQRSHNNLIPAALDLNATRAIVQGRNRGEDPVHFVEIVRDTVRQELVQLFGCDATPQEDCVSDEDLSRSFVELLKIVAFSRSISLRGDDAVFLPRRRSSHRLRIEDPIELDHDLGTTLTTSSLAKLRHVSISALNAVAQSENLASRHFFGGTPS